MHCVKKAFHRPIIRTMAGPCGENKQLPPSLVKLKRVQMHYQREDGKPVWLKGGFSDRILYTSTLVLCGVGVLSFVCIIYDFAKPPSWKESE